MYKFKVSYKNPFWSRRNDNKPSKLIFEKWIKENLVEAPENLPFTFYSIFKGTLNATSDGIKYIQVSNTNNPSDIRYYYVDSVNFVGSENTYTYTLILDTYCTFTLDFIERNKNKDFIFIRKHDYEKQVLQIADENIEDIPKFYLDYTFQKLPFNKTENDIWFGNKIGIQGKDLLNANKYYVFRNGINGGYKFYPILSKSLKTKVFYQKKVKGDLLYEQNFTKGRFRNYATGENNYVESIDPTLNSKVVDAYNNDNIVEYYYQNVNYVYRFPAHTVVMGNWNIIPNLPRGVFPLDIGANNTAGNNAGAGLRYIKIEDYAVGNQIYYHHSWNITVSKFGDIDYVGRENRVFKVKIYKNVPVNETISVKNSELSLEELRRKEENINQFVGIYYLPHFLNFEKFEIEGDYIYVTIKPTGENFPLFPIFQYNLSNIQDKYNNTTFSTPYLLKYANIKYYGNDIKAEYRVNDMNTIFIGGKIFFTDVCTIVSKSDNLISLEESIINYPYQLPIGVNEYEQYVKANRNVTDTSFNIAKQQQDLQFAKSIFGGVMGISKSVIGGATGAGSKLMKGDIFGAVGSAVGGTLDAMNTIGNTAFDIAGQNLGIQATEQKIRAQYQQAKNTKGNNIQFSNVQTASLTQYYDSDIGEQYEGVEISTIDPNTLAMINNYILLNGYFNPEKDTFDKRINNERKFNYIQIDITLLINTLNINYSNEYTNDIFNLIVEQLSNGIRIWNEEELILPEYDYNEPWPEKPERPEILPPTPPIQQDTETNLLLPFDFDYYNKRAEIVKGSCLIEISRGNIESETALAFFLESNETVCTEEVPYKSDGIQYNPNLIKQEIVIKSKFGLCEQLQWENNKPLYLATGTFDPEGIILKLEVPNIDTVNYKPLFDYKKDSTGGIPPTVERIPAKISEIWLNGKKVL